MKRSTILFVLVSSAFMSVATAQFGTLNPFTFPGSDIGAQINNAAGTCSSNSQCWIVLPPGTQLSFSTPIVFSVDNETVECPRSGGIDNTTGGDSTAKLNYTGNGVAVTMDHKGGRFVGCDLLLGSNALAGIVMGGYSNHAVDVGVRGGGLNTYLVHVSGSAAEDNHLENSRLSDFVGIGIGIDHSNDTFVTDTTAYGKTGNSTGVTVLIDSNAGGTYFTNLTGGNSGLHFFKAQYSGGLYPTFIFARNMQADLPSSDAFVFDGTLGSSNIDFTCVDCWAAGAGGSGLHVSGGSGIRWIGGKIRANAKDGVTIDGGSEVGFFLEDSLIEGNNTSNAGYNGISISGHPNAVSVIGNIIQNWPEPSGNQQYGISTSSDIEGLIFVGNQCSTNVKGCANLSSVVSTKLTSFGNINTVAGISTETNYFAGPVNTTTGYQFNGTNGFTGTKTAGACRLTIQGGIITSVSGC